MKEAKLITGMLGVFLALPIWFYLLYRVLDSVNADSLMWFLYWVYIPINLLVAIIGKLVEEK